METQNEKRAMNVVAAIEAILFLYGEPISIGRILATLKAEEALKHTTKDEVQNALDELRGKLEKEDRGLTLISSSEENEVQLATKPLFAALFEAFIKEEFTESLSPASLETLSLIAYLGPLSRASLDYYRGVNSSFILRNLLIRGLIDRKPDPKKGNVYLYQASFDLLKYLGVKSSEELPEYQKFKNLGLRHEEGTQTNNTISVESAKEA